MENSGYRQGRLIRRYKRFLADVELEDGSIETIHCPNTGSMKNCIEAGARIWMSVSDNPSRKYPCTWELTKTSRGHFIGVNTARANQLVREAILREGIGELTGYRVMETEKKYGAENSRIDILLSGHDALPDCYVEVKSVTLLESPVAAGRGCFPDSVTERGTRHLRELQKVVEKGDRGVLFFCVQHSGIRQVHPAGHIDETYACTLREVMKSGVEVLAYKVSYRGKRPAIRSAIPFHPESPVTASHG